MPDIIVVTAAVIESLRRKAKQLKKESGIPHHEALEIVARKGGVFANWHQVVEAAKATEPSERVGEMARADRRHRTRRIGANRTRWEIV